MLKLIRNPVDSNRHESGETDASRVPEARAAQEYSRYFEQRSAEAARRSEGIAARSRSESTGFRIGWSLVLLPCVLACPLSTPDDEEPTPKPPGPSTTCTASEDGDERCNAKKKQACEDGVWVTKQDCGETNKDCEATDGVALCKDPPGTCLLQGHVQAVAVASYDNDVTHTLLALSADARQDFTEIIQIVNWPPDQEGFTQTGIYDLANQNDPRDCGFCVLAIKDPGKPTERRFVLSTGSVDIQALPTEPLTRVNMTLTNLVLREIDNNGDDAAGGALWCIDSIKIDKRAPRHSCGNIGLFYNYNGPEFVPGQSLCTGDNTRRLICEAPTGGGTQITQEDCTATQTACVFDAATVTASCGEPPAAGSCRIAIFSTCVDAMSATTCATLGGTASADPCGTGTTYVGRCTRAGQATSFYAPLTRDAAEAQCQADGGTWSDPCDDVSCSGHGTCDVAQGAPLCSCTTGYELNGTTACVEVEGSCTTVAKCVELITADVCALLSGTFSVEQPCVSDADPNWVGTCAQADVTQHYYAAGTAGSSAAECAPNTWRDRCTDFVCLEHEACVLTANTPGCVCGPGYQGDPGACVVDLCYQVTCSGHGTCSVQGDAAQCDCNEHYVAEALNCVADTNNPP